MSSASIYLAISLKLLSQVHTLPGEILEIVTPEPVVEGEPCKEIDELVTGIPKLGENYVISDSNYGTFSAFADRDLISILLLAGHPVVHGLKDLAGKPYQLDREIDTIIKNKVIGKCISNAVSRLSKARFVYYDSTLLVFNGLSYLYTWEISDALATTGERLAGGTFAPTKGVNQWREGEAPLSAAQVKGFRCSRAEFGHQCLIDLKGVPPNVIIRIENELGAEVLTRWRWSGLTPWRRARIYGQDRPVRVPRDLQYQITDAAGNELWSTP